MDNAKETAKSAARTLDEAFGQGASAEAMLLDGCWYVVTTGTGEGNFAYDPDEVAETVPKFVTDGKFDYSEWCNASASPSEDERVAIAYYLATGRHLHEAGTCTRILSDEVSRILDIVCEVQS